MLRARISDELLGTIGKLTCSHSPEKSNYTISKQYALHSRACRDTMRQVEQMEPSITQSISLKLRYVSYMVLYIFSVLIRSEGNHKTPAVPRQSWNDILLKPVRDCVFPVFNAVMEETRADLEKICWKIQSVFEYISSRCKGESRCVEPPNVCH
jgi:hypothetical protein